METWGLAWDYRGLAFDLLFEIHDRQKYGWAKYSEENFENYPEKFVTRETFPFKEVDDFLGNFGFWSSIAYMLGLALYLRVPDISLWGVHAAEDYSYQRDNIFYLFGIAHMIGSRVQIQDGSKLKLPRRIYGDDFNGDEYHGAGKLHRPPDGADGLVRP